MSWFRYPALSCSERKEHDAGERDTKERDAKGHDAKEYDAKEYDARERDAKNVMQKKHDAFVAERQGIGVMITFCIR